MKEEKINHYLKKVHQIDKILSPAVESLIKIAVKEAPKDDPLREIAKNPVFFPPWLSKGAVAPVKDYLLTRTTCTSALLQVWRVRRRFPQLDLKNLGDPMNIIEETFVPKGNDFKDISPYLDSDTFGGLNPFTASAILSILMDAGEHSAHSGLGFLACFTMLWSLHRKFPKNHASGARMDPWGPSTFVTAKCLLPFHSLRRLALRRARSIEQTNKVLSNLMKLCGEKNPDPYARWKFTFSLDDLSNILSAASKIAIVPQAFENCSEKISALSQAWNGLNPQGKLDEVIGELNTTLTTFITERKKIAQQAKITLCEVNKRIVKKLEDDCEKKIWEHAPIDQSLYDWKLPEEWSKSEAFWKDLEQAAGEALKECERALEIIESPEIPKTPDGGPTFDGVQKILLELKNSHEHLAEHLDKTLRDHASGCLQVVEREIAYISAEDETNFDPSELVHAIMVAVQWDEMRSTLTVQDALRKAVEGKRKDGSWRPGRPFYTYGRALAVVPITSDIVWPLATAVMAKPEIDVADAAFEHYVDWLERTQVKLKARSPFSDGEIIEVTGWASERARGFRRIDLWATALAINALLEIRDIFEERLWQLCKKYYTVLPAGKGLNDELDPVDLRLPHVHRLHRKLSRIFPNAQGGSKEAAYTSVLHGPPGSSKTSIAKALAAEIWQTPGAEETREPRFVRITPADFTRRGEMHLDAEARSIFDLLQGLRRVTVFFDEIDDLLHRRDLTTGPTFMKLVVPAMLNRLQDLRDACPRQEVCVVFATNYIDQIEPALLRKGRVDESILVVYQDWESRRMTVWKSIHKNSQKPELIEALKQPRVLEMIEEIVQKTNEQSWKSLDGLCKCIFQKWEAKLEKGVEELRKSLERCIAEHEAFFTKHEYDGNRTFSCKELQTEILTYYFHSVDFGRFFSRDASEGKYLAFLKERLSQKKTEGWDFEAKGKEFLAQKMSFCQPVCK